MNKNGKEAGKQDREAERQSRAAAKQPDWASGLRQLYDSVVDEPLPESFRELLARLDDGD